MLTAWANLFGHKKTEKTETISAMAEAQEALNQSFTSFMDEANKRIERLEQENQTLRGAVRALRQYNLSLADLLTRHGIEVPKPNFTSVALMFSNDPNDLVLPEESEHIVSDHQDPKGQRSSKG